MSDRPNRQVSFEHRTARVAFGERGERGGGGAHSGAAVTLPTGGAVRTRARVIGTTKNCLPRH